MLQGTVSPCSKGSKMEHTQYQKTLYEITEGHDKGKHYTSRFDAQKLNKAIKAKNFMQSRNRSLHPESIIKNTIEQKLTTNKMEYTKNVI